MKVYKSLHTLQRDLFAGKTTCFKVVSDYISNIEQKKDLNAFVEVFEKSALERAKALDIQLKSGKPEGKLFGLVIGLKDNIAYKEHKCTAASKILSEYTSPYSATVVERLLREGAIILGRLNSDEFSMGSSNEHSYYGPVKNPVNPEYVPGGSSGGPAAAVAADLCMAALGSDTGGSVRQPAAFCGIVGLKPTYGRVSRYGLTAYASSFDQVGPMANNVEDAAKILEVIAGKDKNDSTTSSLKVEDYVQNLHSDRKYRIAYYSNEIENENINPEIKEAIKNLILFLQSDGHTVEPVTMTELKYAPAAYYILTAAEASSNLARYDGVRYGYRAQNAEDLDTIYKKSRSEGFGDEVKRRIMTGAFVLKKGNIDLYYTKAQKVRRIIAEKTIDTFRSYDFLLSPISPNLPCKIGTQDNNPVSSYLSDIFTVQANLAGIPGISLPVGKAQNGLPIGVQFMADKFEESKLLALGKTVLEKYPQ